jgi:kynurenine formamidase
MCVPGCQEKVLENLSRRDFLGGGLALAAGAAAAALAGAAGGCAGAAGSARLGASAAVDVRGERARFPAFTRVVDLTHTYSSRFPHYAGGTALLEKEVLMSTGGGDAWNLQRWRLDEHVATHIDAPFHKNAAGLTAERIPAEDLVLALAVIDLRDKARADRDALLTVEDVEQWEAKHGPLPERACVAMLSGWDAKVASAEFIGFDDERVRHFPGFHPEAVRFFLEERSVVAIAVDTASFDHGPTADFPVHTLWLGANRWGLENAAHLAEVPARGATIVCGAPKVEGASGGPSRVFALV